MASTQRFSEFYPTMIRALLFFTAWWKWLLDFAIRKTESTKPKTIAQTQQEYSEKYLTRFLEFTSQPSEFKNANIDAVIQDAEALAEILKDANNDVEKQWRRRVLIETTPRGNVFMFYDIYKRAFSYYCDQAVMPYKIINAAAMKYVMTFRCCDFFVDSSVLGTPVTEDKDKKDEEPTKYATNPAFAKFKTYNVASKKAEIKKEAEKTINGFLHLGQVRNWSIIEKPKRANPLNGFKTDLVPSNTKLSYKDYKLLNKNK